MVSQLRFSQIVQKISKNQNIQRAPSRKGCTMQRQRFLLINDSPMAIGNVLDDSVDSEGIINIEGESFREAFLENQNWDSITLVSKGGDVIQSHYNIWDDKWYLGERKSFSLSESGKINVCVGSGCGATSMRLVRAMAIAWIEYPNSEEDFVAAQIDDSKEVSVENIGWIPRGAHVQGVPFFVSEPVQESVLDESWREPKIYKYYASGDKCVDFKGTGYMLSPSGRLRKRNGSYTKGVLSYNHKYRYCLASGSVWAADLISDTFYGKNPDSKHLCVGFEDGNCLNHCASNLVLVEKIPRRKSTACEALECFLNCENLQETCEKMHKGKGGLWMLLNDAVKECKSYELGEREWNLLLFDPSLRQEMFRLIKENNPVLGKSLKEIREHITESTSLEHLDLTDTYGMIRVGKVFANSFQ